MTSAGKKFLIIAVAAVVAAVAGIMYVFPKPDERVEEPEKYVRLALQNTYGLLRIPAYDADWVYDLINDRHSAELGFAFNEIDADVPLDSRILSMAQLARLNAFVERDVNERRMTADISLAGGGVEMLNARLYLDDNELAVKLPQGFDYFVTATLQELGDGWLGLAQASALPVDSGVFYSAYKSMFDKVAKPAKLKLINDTLALYMDAEYESIGVEDDIYSYSMRIKADSFNTWYRSMAESIEDYEPFREFDMNALYYFSVTGDIEVLMNVADDRLISAKANTLLQDGVSCSAEINLRGEANPFDDVYALINMKNPKGGAMPTAEVFDAQAAITPYLMIEEMPPEVDIEITHTGGGEAAFVSKANINMSSGGDSTEISWAYSWNPNGDELDNLKLNAGITQHSGGRRAGITASVLGSFFEDREKGELLANLHDIDYRLTDFNGDEQALGLLLKLNLKPAQGAVDYDRAGATPIAELTPMQLMRIYANFKADPVIGGFLE